MERFIEKIVTGMERYFSAAVGRTVIENFTIITTVLIIYQN